MHKDIAKAAGLLLVVCAVAAIWNIVDFLPIIGDPGSAPNTHISQRFIELGPIETNSPNMVTGVLADYRGFDTLWETTVMYLAGMSVAMILSNRLKKKWDPAVLISDKTFGGPDVKAVMPLVVPIIIVYAIYVLFHGEVSLGGGFQAGALIAMAYIIYTMVAGIEIRCLRMTQHFSVCLAAGGVMIYALTGLIPMLLGGKFLEYSKLPFPVHEAELHSLGILGIEIGVTCAVAATIITILDAVLERKSLHDGN